MLNLEKFSPFSQSDFDAYAGVESNNPLIYRADLENGRDLVVIVDNANVEAIISDEEGIQIAVFASAQPVHALMEIDDRLQSKYLIHELDNNDRFCQVL